MEEYYEGKEAIVNDYGNFYHRYDKGEKITLLFTEDVKSNENEDIVVWYTFENANNLKQTLVESEFKWLEEEED